MATPEQVADVRENVDEPTADRWDDDTVELLIDQVGIYGASATIWRKKAGMYAHLVNVSEAGSSHNYSDLHKNALAMEKKYMDLWATEGGGGVVVPLGGRVKVRNIQRDLRE